MLPKTVIDVLREAVRHDDEIRLVKSGKNDGPVKKRSGKENVEAIKICTDPRQNLFEIREEKKGKTTHWFVKITDHGLEKLVDSVKATEFSTLTEEAAPPLRPKINAVCTRSLEKEQQEIIEAVRHQREEAMRLASEGIRTLEQQLQTLKDELTRAYEFQKRLKMTGPPEPPPPGVRPRPPKDAREAETAFEYQRSLCEWLVQGWREATNPEAQDELEITLLNAGLEPVGEVGEVVAFDGIDHETDDPVSPGDPVEIVRPAWNLPLEPFGRNEPGEVYQLCRAVVRSVAERETTSSENSSTKEPQTF